MIGNKFVFEADQWADIVQHLDRPPNEEFYKRALESICSNYRARKKTTFPDVKSQRANDAVIARAAKTLQRHLLLHPSMPGLLEHLDSAFMHDLDWIVETFDLIEKDESLFMASRAGTAGRMGLERQALWRPLLLIWRHRFGKITFSPTGPLMRFIIAFAAFCDAPVPKPLSVRGAVKALGRKNG